MAERSGAKWTPEEDRLILDLPLVPGATRKLALEIGRTRVAVSMRKAELNGTRNHTNKGKPRGSYKKKEQNKTFLPVARPAWFENEDLTSLLLLKNT